MREGQVVEIEAYFVCESDAAYCVELGPEEPGQIWLPKRCTERTPGKEADDLDTFVIPEWLAVDKGLA